MPVMVARHAHSRPAVRVSVKKPACASMASMASVSAQAAPAVRGAALLRWRAAPACAGLAARARTAPAVGAVVGAKSAVRAVRCVAAAAPKKVLIVNTNSGGHANIGFWLSKTLAAAGHAVTILTVGAQDSDKMKKAPFAYFDELRAAGVTTAWGEPSALAAALPGAKFDIVVDNNGKDMDSVGPVIAHAKAVGASQFLFVSSAGVYKVTDEPPHVEGDAVKADAGHVLVEAALAASGMAWSSFRPQYLTGYGSNKDCEEWFFDRIARGRAIPIPGSGVQMTVVAHAEDLATMIAAAAGNPAAAGRVFNAVADRGITLDGMAKLCAKVAGAPAPQIVHYDPKKVEGVDVKKAFPFRPVHFYAEPRAAKAVLGWKPKWTLEAALADRWKFYEASGRGKKDKAFPDDDLILAAAAKK